MSKFEAVELTSCEVCHRLEPLCSVCDLYQAFLTEEARGATCVMCEQPINEPYLGGPMLDPHGHAESHFFHYECLPEDAMPCPRR